MRMLYRMLTAACNPLGIRLESDGGPDSRLQAMGRLYNGFDIMTHHLLSFSPPASADAPTHGAAVCHFFFLMRLYRALMYVRWCVLIGARWLGLWSNWKSEVDSCLHHCGGSDTYRNDNITQAQVR